jgi:hypothetical protein
MAHCTVSEVQSWLQSTKLKIDNIDPDLETSAVNIVFGQLGAIYVTTGWLDDTNTPSIVQTILCMLLASWIYRRAYAENIETDLSYPSWLEDEANMLIQMIVGGTIAIAGATPISSSITSIEGWPVNLTGSSQQQDAAGNNVGWNAYSEDIKFRIGDLY